MIWHLDRMRLAWPAPAPWTPGILHIPGVQPIMICEPPPLYEGQLNVPLKTCILADIYDLTLHSSKMKLRLEDKHGRTNVEVHPGDWPRDTEACLLPGLGFQYDGSGVAESRAAMRLVLKAFNGDSHMGRVAIKITDPPLGEQVSP